MKEISVRQFASIKRIAMNVNPLVVKKNKLISKINELTVEIAEINDEIEGNEMGIKSLTGGFGSEVLVVKKIVDSGKVDKNGNPIKVTKYEPNPDIVKWDENKKVYIINNVEDENLRCRSSVQLIGATVPFLILFVAFLVRTLLKDGYAYDPESGIVSMEPMKYFHNLTEMWQLAVLLLIGLVLALYGIIRTIVSKTYIRGIWPTGAGVILVVLVLLLLAGWNHTAYYPSNTDLQSSLTIENSSSSYFTLSVMSIVSLLVPFVVAYIAYCWHALDRGGLSHKDLEQGNHQY